MSCRRFRIAAASVRPDFSRFPANGAGITAARRHALVCRTVCRIESPASLYLHQQPGILKRLDTQLSPPPVQVLLSAGGELPWQDVKHTASWLRVWPDEIYGSTETGVIAWRYREQEQRRWLPFPGMHFQAEGEAFRLFSPLIAEDSNLLLSMISCSLARTVSSI